MSLRQRRRAPSAEEENTYWISFTDVMSALLILFILAAVALMLQLATKQDELGTALAEVDKQIEEQEVQQRAFDEQIGTINEAEEVRAQLLVETRDELERVGIDVTLSEDSSVLSIPSSALGFESGNYEIADAYQEPAEEIGSVLSKVLRTANRTDYLDTVFIEGHTDSQPFDGPLGMDNWGLSTFRAISLWQFWDDSLPSDAQLDTLTNSDGHPLFSVSGYADTRPIEGAPEDAIAYAPNRRIDIRITIVRPSSDDLEQIRDEFSEGL